MTQYEYAILCKLIELHTEEEDDINGNVHRKMYESDIEKLKKDIYEVLVVNMTNTASLQEELIKTFVDYTPTSSITKPEIKTEINDDITRYLYLNELNKVNGGLKK